LLALEGKNLVMAVQFGSLFSNFKMSGGKKAPVSMDLYCGLQMTGRLEAVGNTDPKLSDPYRADLQLEQIRTEAGGLAWMAWVKRFLSILDSNDHKVEALLKQQGVVDYQKQPALEALVKEMLNLNERQNPPISETEARDRASALIAHYQTQERKAKPGGGIFSRFFARLKAFWQRLVSGG
jgi:hypothetical protein